MFELSNSSSDPALDRLPCDVALTGSLVFIVARMSTARLTMTVTIDEVIAWQLAMAWSDRVKCLAILNAPHPDARITSWLTHADQLRKSW